MKCNSKRANLISLSLLGIFGIVGFINLTNGTSLTQIDPPSAESGHVVRLYSLFLWKDAGNTGSVSMKVNTGENFLDVQGGLVIGSGNTVNSDADSAVIGGGFGNNIQATNVGILGGVKNIIQKKNSLIGGGFGNTIGAENAVIGGGSGNVVSANNGVIIGGENNQVGGENGVVLGGQSNKAKGKNSLVGGYGAEGSTGSFAWRARAKENSARINVNSGMLIGTVTPINGVKLVVSGAVSLSKLNNTGSGIGGEIRVVNGCIYANGGDAWKVMGKASKSSCDTDANAKICRFGETPLSHLDQVDAYKKFYSSNCSGEVIKVTCSGGNLVKSTDNQPGNFYPYCYNV